MKMFTADERDNMQNFIKKVFQDEVTEAELNGTDEQLKKLYDEAYSCSDWGL